jgi:tripartite ATP-independent transporter DctM subunit
MAIWIAVFGLLIGLILIGVPIFSAIGMSAMLHYFDLQEPRILVIFMQQIFRTLARFQFLALPMFILAGNIMTEGGIVTRLIELAKALVGRYTGGLAQVNILASVMFAGISGSGNADVAALGTTLIPAMKKEGYPPGFAGTLTAVSGTLTPIIPPSNVMVVYGATYGVSIGALFAGGLVVGSVTAVIYAIVTYFMVKGTAYAVQASDTGELWYCFKRAILPIGAPVVILGGIFSGLFTATEAAAVAVFYSLLLSVIIYRSLNLRDLFSILRRSMYTVAAVLILIGFSRTLSYVIVRRNVPALVMSAVTTFTQDPTLTMILIVVVALIAGMFIDRTTNVLVFGAIMIPIMTDFLGFSEIHTAFILITVLGVGHMTPPVGGTLLTTALVGNVGVEEMMPFMWKFILVEIGITILVITFPFFSEGLPRILGLGLL